MINIPDLPRLHTAIAEWIACVIYLAHMKKRITGIRLYGMLLLCLGLLLFSNLVGEIVPISLWMVFFLMGMAVMFLMIRICSQSTGIEAGYYWARAFLVAEFAASLEWQINFYIFSSNGYQFWAEFTCMSLVYLVVFSGIYLLETNRMTSNNSFPLSRKELIGSLLIALAAFSISNINFVFQNTFFSITMGAGSLAVRTLVDVAGIILLFAHEESRREINLRCELEAMDNLFHRQYEQYQQFAKNNESIQRMYHDLKHQIAFILAETDVREKEKYLSEITKAISIYNAEVQTGNPVLDTLIASKSLLCVEKKVKLTYYADAKQLDFMDVMDICSLFGNALENAIEYAVKIEDQDKRLIKVAVYPQNHLLIIRIDNYCEEQIVTGNELPGSTKKDQALHGFGIKSMKRVVEKYGGHISISNQENWFTVMMLLPLPEE